MSEFYALLFTVAFSVMVLGLAFKIIQYAMVPAPLKIPVTPAPVTKSGVVLRLAKEAILFAALAGAVEIAPYAIPHWGYEYSWYVLSPIPWLLAGALVIARQVLRQPSVEAVDKQGEQ